MRVSLNTVSIGNSQPLRFGCCGDKKPACQNYAAKFNGRDSFDYKEAYEKSQMELAYTQRKYELASNLLALYFNPRFK